MPDEAANWLDSSNFADKQRNSMAELVIPDVPTGLTTSDRVDKFVARSRWL
ncbi:hypothetical protein RBWH47_01013 [Rhodopirellula baltica WH47]|uniref:Uncharacterized protein n=1 Tax=Rhodopirellula baltica WH47 TaxID=991778 RepID=F2AYP0_RHOBT|nr:hypothetical protein RBWH47_01013 [Rhodopirellula baltica WH47]